MPSNKAVRSSSAMSAERTCRGDRLPARPSAAAHGSVMVSATRFSAPAIAPISPPCPRDLPPPPGGALASRRAESCSRRPSLPSSVDAPAPDRARRARPSCAPTHLPKARRRAAPRRPRRHRPHRPRRRRRRPPSALRHCRRQAMPPSTRWTRSSPRSRRNQRASIRPPPQLRRPTRDRSHHSPRYCRRGCGARPRRHQPPGVRRGSRSLDADRTADDHQGRGAEAADDREARWWGRGHRLLAHDDQQGRGGEDRARGQERPARSTS